MNADTHPSVGNRSGDPALAEAGRIPALLRARINRQTACSMVTCVHCGKCAQSCHYALARPHDPFMTPAYKADQIRKIFNRHLDWMGRIFPRWVGARGKTEEDFIDSLSWVRDEVQYELGVDDVEIGVDKEDCDLIYAVNPREVKYDPRSLINAAKFFYLAGESWTLSRYGWDQTNFGLFSGDDRLGAFMAGNLYQAAERLRAKRIVVSECGHGYRSVRWEGYNWAKYNQTIPTESVIETIMRYLREGRIKVDRSRNTASVTFHDSCNVARYGGLVEEPRWILKQICSDLREMHPNGINNFCCTGGSGLLVMPEYRALRLEVAKIKAEQLKTTGADVVCTMCHNCRDGLGDLISHYQLDMKVVQIMDLVAGALILPEKQGS